MLNIVTFISRGRVGAKKLRNGIHKIWELKEYFLGFLVLYKIMRMEFMDKLSPVKITNDNLLIPKFLLSSTCREKSSTDILRILCMPHKKLTI